MAKSQPIFAITGPTAAGKTSVSIELAKCLNAEIISVDSALVYKRMDIGTAKPSIEEQEGVKHHLIDIIEPWESYSVSRFIDDAKVLIDAIWQQGKNVLFVGGTMLYLKGLVEGISSLPEVDPVIRKKVREQSLSESYQLLKEKDPTSATSLSATDTQRVQRALEITLSANKAYSELIATEQKKGGIGESLKVMAFVPEDRAKLHKKIEMRFQQMLKMGFLEEVEALFQHDKMDVDLPSMRSVGYRQAWQYLQGDISYDDFVYKSIVATRQLAKRQLTWIRNWPYSCDYMDANLSDASKLSAIKSWINRWTKM
ncbi:tRNA (adenosine(37)-N6)-dimethylallyltransferase MiaA [Fangia hongkongensis]|uniref:tRNA (adenosine(37)-N6)-dimethylallyltransferase MiaA n=1 Tax=Fangia hongkongensis TaxID=270495 RepID=UPI000375585B|nr:tRNA (adenosine(37)-N6)-dimethylallyltransferase MiaA [Fangia hongkongensis]MBK2123956.1 tRNA (adenosine(37)-N6)-dimethylallyltransferase MiaA [Fangia hongkongensis]